MKFKKLLAAAAAVSLAISSMGVTSFATITPGSTNADCTHENGWENGACKDNCGATCDHENSLTYTATGGSHTGTCSVCNGTVTGTCDEDGVYDKDATQHWKKCSVCGTAKDNAAKTNHSYDGTTHLCDCGAEDPDAGSGQTPAAPAWSGSNGSYTISGAYSGEPSPEIAINVAALAAADEKTTADIQSISISISCTKYANGCIGANKDGTWKQVTWDPDTGALTITASDFDSIDSLLLQYWYGEDGAGAAVSVAINYKGAGNNGGGAGGGAGAGAGDDDNKDDDTPPPAGSIVINGSDFASTEWGVAYEFSDAIKALLANPDTVIVIEYNSPNGWEDIGFGVQGGTAGDWANKNFAANQGSGVLTITAADIASGCGIANLNGLTYGKLEGYNGTTFTKVTFKPAGDVSDDNNNNDNNNNDNNNNNNSSTTTTNPAPIVYTPTTVTSADIADKVAAIESGSGTISLGASTKLDKAAIEALAGKADTTVTFKVSGNAYWEITGANITNAKSVDLGVKVNSNKIPENKVESFAGDKKTVQLSLNHNGDFGFTAVLNIPVGSSNNGKFANLYYYHGGQFEFVGSSPISGGRTQFAFSHASNYLIVVDDYAYGEDVSSAAPAFETPAETSAFPYAAVVVVLAAFGTSAIVLKKRLSK
ncbi:MAG: hypothetical protein NC253_09900 [Ruminococcus sp.]|nr:hypothetical protein [Ruminococcus sp.]MCM1382725.1 hypothetical protein [Muribaculaceae bacterium]MCM1479102.1 hypothetical protein [Muribaculaceae bacterium]